MTDRLAEIKARCEAATPGPWCKVSDLPDYGVASMNHPGTLPDPVVTLNRKYRAPGRPNLGCSEFDADFIAHAREDIPFLLAEVERLRALEAEHKRQWMEDKYEMGNLRAERDTLRRQLEAYQELLSAASRLMSVTSLRGEPEANLLKAIWKIEAIGKGGGDV